MSNNDLTKKFVSEEEVEAQKKKRQEEWEKVRRPDQPEGKYDNFVYAYGTVSLSSTSYTGFTFLLYSLFCILLLLMFGLNRGSRRRI